MRWLVFLIAALLLYVLEEGLGPLWRVAIGPRGAAEPALLMVLAVWVALRAPRPVAYWAVLVVGLLDGLRPLAQGQQFDVVLPAPVALGYLVGGHMLLRIRNAVFPDSLTATPAMTVIFGLFVHLTIVLLVTLRGLPFLPSEPLPHWHAADELLQRSINLAYTVLVALPVGWLLNRTRGWWGMQANKSR